VGAECRSDIASGQDELPLLGEAAELLGISPIRKRLIEAATEIRQSDPDELTFMHTVLTQCALPAAKPSA